VKDTFFAYVIGILQAGIEVDIDNAGMREILTEFKSAMSFPFDLIARVTQHEDGQTGERRIGLDFSHDVDIPIPFALLFYHPGSITAGTSIRFDVRRSTYQAPGGTTPPDVVYDLALVEGWMLVDIDSWLEVILSAYLEDVWIQHIVFLTMDGDWMGMLEGTGKRTERVLRAYFNFTHNRIVFPIPVALDRAGRAMAP
jgi:hypothetical protein